MSDTSSILPSWETIPHDLAAATVQIKAALRASIEANGRTVREVIDEVESFLSDEIAEIQAVKTRGDEVWPAVRFVDVASGSVTDETRALIRRRGCVVVKGNFDRDVAVGWDQSIVDYVESNRFFENYRGPGDSFFESVDSKPDIYPIYWSAAQMEARQHHPDPQSVWLFTTSTAA